ncbi:MAG: EI24 domain-containing protein [Deltaproteobacteria bacterium]|nr:EI24 domain-containing protein [Deltaproteobacteria bacterium]
METRPLPSGTAGQVSAGLAYPLRGLGFISRHGLWGSAAIPIIVNAALFAALVAATVWLVVPRLEALDQYLSPATDAWAITKGLLSALSWLIWIAAIILLLTVDSIVLLMIGQAVASPFLDLLSEKVEAIVLGKPAPSFSMGRAVRAVLVAIADLVWALVFWALVNLGLLLLNLLPAVGSAVAAALSFCFTALLLTQEFVGLALVRQFVSYSGRFGVVWRNKWLSLGFGSTTMLLLLVPVLNLMLLPLAAAGGTLLYCDLKAAGRGETRR